MKKIATCILAVVLSAATMLNAQSVGINADGSTPETSAMLDVKSTDKGFLAPRMTVAQRDAMPAKTAGLLIYQTDSTPGYYYYSGSAWLKLDAGLTASQWTSGTGNISYSGGNVGIGTTSPQAKLQVDGNVFINNAAAPGFYGQSAGVSKVYLGYDAAGTGLQLYNFTSSKSLMIQDNGALVYSGNVGIGTDAPTAQLDVLSSNTFGISSTGSTTGPSGLYHIANSNAPTSWNLGVEGGTWAGGSLGSLYIDEANVAPRMIIAPGGNVGIGTTTPGYKLHVAGGTIRCELGSNGVSGAFVGGGSNLQIYHSASSSVYFLNSASGVYEYYNAAGSTSTGTLVAGAYTTGSDRRLKNNIANTHFGVSDLMKIQVRDYTYKADAANTPTTGFIAQELYDIFPNAVTKPAKEEDMWSIDYGKVTPLLVKAIQDQQKQIDELKELVKQLQKK